MARLHDLKHADIENAYWGVATSLWFNGCPHRCKNCWNEETWAIDDTLDRDNGAIILETLTALDEYGMAKDLSLLGGDPLAPYNLPDMKDIVRGVKTIRPQTRVLCWTGYTWEQLTRNSFWIHALELIDILIDGRYEQSLHVEGHKFGSRNQRVIDVQKSLQNGQIVLAPEEFDE